MEARRRCVLCEAPGPLATLYERHGHRWCGARRAGWCSAGVPRAAARRGDARPAYCHDPEFAHSLEHELRPQALATARSELERLRPAELFADRARVLDVGCSSGAWLELAGEAGFEGTGVEIGEATAAAARERGLDVITGTVRRLPRCGGARSGPGRRISMAPMDRDEMRRFWDARAEENALFFVDNKLDYRNPDEALFWTRGEAELDSVLEPVGATLRPSDDVVEIGCGVGRMTRVIARRAATVRALDISPRMLERAREYNPGLDTVEWLLGDGVSLAPIADSSADACVSHVVFHHIPDPAITLGYVREIGRVLRPGGWAAFQISNAPELHHPRSGREGLQIRWRALTGRGPKGQAARPWIGSAIGLDELREAAADGAMDVERVVGEGEQLCFVLTRRRR